MGAICCSCAPTVATTGVAPMVRDLDPSTAEGKRENAIHRRIASRNARRNDGRQHGTQLSTMQNTAHSQSPFSPEAPNGALTRIDSQITNSTAHAEDSVSEEPRTREKTSASLSGPASPLVHLAHGSIGGTHVSDVSSNTRTNATADGAERPNVRTARVAVASDSFGTPHQQPRLKSPKHVVLASPAGNRNPATAVSAPRHATQPPSALELMGSAASVPSGLGEALPRQIGDANAAAAASLDGLSYSASRNGFLNERGSLNMPMPMPAPHGPPKAPMAVSSPVHHRQQPTASRTPSHGPHIHLPIGPKLLVPHGSLSTAASGGLTTLPTPQESGGTALTQWLADLQPTAAHSNVESEEGRMVDGE